MASYTEPAHGRGAYLGLAARVAGDRDEIFQARVVAFQCGDRLDSHVQRQRRVARAALEQRGSVGRVLLAKVQDRAQAGFPGGGIVDDRLAERGECVVGSLGGQRGDRVSLDLCGLIVDGALDHCRRGRVLVVPQQLQRGHLRANRQAWLVEQCGGGAAAARRARG